MSGRRASAGVRGFTRFVRQVVLVPIFVCVLLLAATIGIWQEIKKHYHAEQAVEANEHLEFVVAHLAAHLEVRLVLAHLIHQEWQDHKTHTREDLQEIVGPKLQRFQDIQAINWVDKDGIIRWVNPVEGNKQALGLNLQNHAVASKALNDAARTGTLQVSAPLDLAQGGRGFVVYIPYRQDGALRGFINIVFRVETLIANALPSEQRNLYDLHIVDEGSSLLMRHADSHLTEPKQKSFNIANRVWTVEVAPTEQFRKNITNHNDTIFLAIGMFISAALSLMLSLVMHHHMQLRQSERRFADFADISSDWFWETDDQLRFSFFSPRFEVVSGVPPQQLLGKTREEVGAPDSDPVQYQILLENMRDRLPFRDFEHSRQRPDGTLSFLSISGRPVFDDNDIFIGYRGVGSDITGRKKDQKTLHDALIASEQANRAKSEFLATMSHEFRTPLNAIIGFSEMLREEYFGPLGSKTYKDYSIDIYNSGRHMLDLVNDVLDFSAIEASKRSMHMEMFQLASVMNDGLRSVEALMRNKDLTLEYDIPVNLPDMHADRRSVYQIILNLLSNAVKFTNQGGRITVSASVSDTEFSITISDTGIGIADDKLATITEPFSQSHADPHITGTGTGLGLTIVKSLVDAHRGKMDIKSEIGTGTTIRIAFPRRQDVAGDSDANSDAAPGSST